MITQRPPVVKATELTGLALFMLTYERAIARTTAERLLVSGAKSTPIYMQELLTAERWVATLTG